MENWRKQVRLQMWKLLQEAEAIVHCTAVPMGKTTSAFDAIMSDYDDLVMYYRQRDEEERLRGGYRQAYGDTLAWVAASRTGRLACAYCKTSQSLDASNCQNCGAPL